MGLCATHPYGTEVRVRKIAELCCSEGELGGAWRAGYGAARRRLSRLLVQGGAQHLWRVGEFCAPVLVLVLVLVPVPMSPTMRGAVARFHSRGRHLSGWSRLSR
jgi:hypothetical protein